MVTDVTRKYRDILCFALLGVAALYCIGALSLLFKSTDGAGFSVKAAFVGTYFEAPVPVLCLVVAVLLATRFGDLSANARIVALVALGIAGLDLLFGVIAFFAQLGADRVGGFSGVAPAGKIVGVILGLAQLLFLATAGFFFLTTFQGLPAPVPAQAPMPWGTDRGFGQYGAPGQPGPGEPASGQPAQSQSAPGQPIWRPAEPAPGPQGVGWAQRGWGQPPADSAPASAAAEPTAEASDATTAPAPPAAEDGPPAAQGWWQHPQS